MPTWFLAPIAGIELPTQEWRNGLRGIDSARLGIVCWLLKGTNTGSAVPMGPTKLWRSNSIFNLYASFADTDDIQYMYNIQESEDGCNKYILFKKAFPERIE
jgi:hypothetical protein